mmetsp:Transcript_84300/g.247266  ORF Transcript_84300/g.247266 Transcript_84300/m.247266 type:complete len:1173 (-) Transcript_84300:83-3601(-)
MTDKLEVGLKLNAKYSDGEFYPAEIVQISESKRRAKAPVKVHFTGYGSEDDAWLAIEDLKSKRLPKAAGKAKAKAKAAKAKPEMDYSGLEKGMRVQAEADGVYYAAEVVTVSTSKNRSKAPVKVHFMGYTNASDEWVGADRLRSKAIKPKKDKDSGDKPKRTGKPLGSMPAAAKKLLLVTPAVPAPLDPDFAPVVLGKKKYLEAAKDCKDKLDWALVRTDGCARYTLPVFPEKSKDVMASTFLAGVLIQEMLWQRSGYQLLLCGPSRICKALKRAFSKGGAYEFEISSMPNVCGTPEQAFEVKIVASVDEMPEAKDSPQEMGKDSSGCRLAFDLGKSDIKTVAVKDGEVLYSKETEWDVTDADPQYHYDAVVAALKLAAEKLPKVEAIGGSATGTVGANNEATWCDIFPNVPRDVYKEKVVDIFTRIAKEVAGDVPLKVINDGEVTALAGMMMVKEGNLMGISMGSSEGAGYVDVDGHLLGWINELCYVPLDLNPEAPYDPWTPHSGTSHMYLGQRAATRLAAKGGVEVPENLAPESTEMNTMKHEPHAKCLKLIQAAMKDPKTEPQARKIYETIGVYLGYAIAQYVEDYEIDNVLILGRVSSGTGGEVMLAKAKEVLDVEFPELAHIKFHQADEHFKRVGQCIAAAALPPLRGRKALSRLLAGWTGHHEYRVHVGAAHGPPDPPMAEAAKKLLLAKPKVVAPLDPDFSPVILGKKKYYSAASSCKDFLEWALIRSDGVGRGFIPVFPEHHKFFDASVHLAGVLIQGMLWQRSAHRLVLCGPQHICGDLQKAFSPQGKYRFEVLTMPKVCGHPETPFEVFIVASPKDLPLDKDTPQVCGSDANGCRLAFDLGKSDIKTVAVKDNEVLATKETEWDVTNPDPQYHWDKILEAMKDTAQALPKIDAIGGSATGTISGDNEATWCDIFPNVPPDVYKAKVVDIFKRIAKEVAGDVPLKVINDGEVTALAAAAKIGAGNIMGISMGSDEGAGYANKDGNLTGWINEMGYVRIDFSPSGARNPWDGGVHTGCSHMYLGQRGATKLAAKGGVPVPENYVYPHADMLTIKHEVHAQCLKMIQEAMKDPEKEAEVTKLYETIGVYLGYTLAQYTEFYPIDHVMLLGRVSKGKGGDVMLATAKKVLTEEFPDINITFHTADDHFKAVGQCIAASALPTLKK